MSLILPTFFFGQPLRKWRDSQGAITVSFDVIPKGGAYLEIGDEYVFVAGSYAPYKGRDRKHVVGCVSITPDPDVLANIQAVFDESERPLCGWASFSRERQGDFEFAPPTVYFNVVVELRGQDARQPRQAVRQRHRWP